MSHGRKNRVKQQQINAARKQANIYKSEGRKLIFSVLFTYLNGKLSAA